MGNAPRLTSDFENAKRALALSLFGPREQYNPAYIKLAIERMSSILNRALITTPAEMGDRERAALQTATRPRQFLCAHAINTGDEYNSRWQVVYMNGELVEDLANAPTVSDFTRQMLADGWQAAHAPDGRTMTTSTAPSGEPIYELYFSRELAFEWEAPATMAQLPELRPAQFHSEN